MTAEGFTDGNQPDSIALNALLSHALGGAEIHRIRW